MIPLSVRTRLTLWYGALLLVVLLVVSGLTYSHLRRSLVHDLDASLLLVARVLADTRVVEREVGPEDVLLRRLLGPEFYDKLVQLLDPEGRMTARSTQLGGRRLPLTHRARAAAERGAETFETVELPDGEQVRVLTMPVMRGGRPVRLVQVALPLERVEQALRRYRETLFILVPLGLGLALAGGAVLARSALSPVDAMSRSARRISAEDLGQRIVPTGTGDELDHLAGTLNDMLARLEAAFSQVRRFAADAAHELRTPLTALHGEIEVALRADRSPEEYRRVLRSSLEEVERLIRLSEDLLLLSRFSAGAPAAREAVDLEPLVVDVFDTGSRLANGTGVTVRLGAVAPATVTGDPGALRRALLNLVENAIKYTPADGKVALSLGTEAGRAIVCVRDTGVGIAAEDVERIFQPFVRLDTARSRSMGGTGLGLAIARSIVETHGGTLAVDSAPGAGSRFTIRLPLALELAAR
jgi:heavy metal sensor kinase